jgi:hypothetical protein
MKLRYGSTALAVVFVSALLSAAQMDPSHETTTPDVPGLTAATSLCKISPDDAYGMVMDKPVKTGGGALYMASRQVKYLSALRGPAGEGVHFKRNGSVRGPDGGILDAYRVEYRGGKTITLYLDPDHWADPLAPVGFLCGAAMNLAPPGPDAFETTRQQRTIAVALGTADVQPISLDADGSKLHGVVYDHTRLIAMAARAAAAAGKPLDANALPRPLAEPRLVLVAFPVVCGIDTVAPESIALADARGNSPPAVAKATAETIAELVPGLAVPAKSIAVAYAVPALINGARTTIRYAQPCSGAPDVTLPVTITPPHVVSEAPAPAPPGSAVPAGGAKVVLQLFVAADGTAQYPAFVSGAFEFTDAAIESLKGWRFEPSRVNGAPLFQAEKVMVVVK